jgi:ribosomal protein S18 acetylase RimI-like enzyme
MSDYKVKAASPADAHALAAIQATAGQAQSPDFWREAIGFSEPYIQVLFKEEVLIGFVGYDRSRDPESKNTVGEIWAIGVLPSHYGSGAGLMLWEAARAGLLEEGCEQVTVWVALDNARALRFFEAQGFKREPNTARAIAKNTPKVQEIRLNLKLNVSMRVSAS